MIEFYLLNLNLKKKIYFDEFIKNFIDHSKY